MSSLHYSVGIPTKLESSEKSVGTMRKFSEQYARHSRTYFTIDKGVTSCDTKLQAKLQVMCRRYSAESGPKNIYSAAILRPWFGSGKNKKDINLGPWSLAAESNQVATNSADKESGNAEKAVGDDQLLANNPPILNSMANGSEHESNGKVKLGTQTLDASNSTEVSSDVKTDTTSSQKIQKRSSLTAREKLRAARVLKRDTEPKPSEFGSKVLDALRESERGKKRSRLPEAPTNLLDDSKRGMPKQGLTFDFPGGFDLFLIVLSFVLITTIMFATTYIVWKLGAIHFNDN